MYKASKKFDGPYRVMKIMKLNKYKLRHIYTKKERVEHANNIKVIKSDIDYLFIQGTNNKVSSQDETTGPTHRYALRSRVDPPDQTSHFQMVGAVYQPMGKVVFVRNLLVIQIDCSNISKLINKLTALLPKLETLLKNPSIKTIVTL